MKKYILYGMFFLSACEPFVNSRGNVVISDQIGSFVIGKTTMSEVMQKCGSPSLQQDKTNLIYVGARSEVVAFKGNSMKDHSVFTLEFDQNNILKNIKRLDVSGTGIELKDEKFTQLLKDPEAEKVVVHRKPEIRSE